jgi:polar amino acid transport system permease protein
VSYTFQFGQVTPYLGTLAAGAWLSLQIAAIAFVAGFIIGLVCASVLQYGGPIVRRIVRAYVVFFLNTPLLVQVFFIYFAMPDFGIVLDSFTAVTIGMALNAGAYLTEIQRAGFASIRRAEVDAAEAMGFSRIQIIRYVVLPHIVRVLYPALSNQYIILTMTTSIAAIFGVEELTGRAYNINAQTFRSLEIFSIVAVYYIVLTIVASAALYALGRYAFRIKGRIA